MIETPRSGATEKHMKPTTRVKLATWRLRWLLGKARDQFVADGSPDIPEVGEAAFDEIFSQYDDEVVFVHVGLSDINTAVSGNPYDFILDRLTDNFESVMGTGYTPSFRSTGIYHKEFSRPKFGVFSRLFLEDAEYRTDDAIHSILVTGDYRFDDYDHHDSFGEDGVRRKLDEDNVLCLNVGTDSFTCLVFHYLEGIMDLPYVTHPEFDGVIYYDETEYDHISQRNYRYTDERIGFPWNEGKVRRRLEAEGLLQDHSIGDLQILAYRFNDVKQALVPLLEADPYYLVT